MSFDFSDLVVQDDDECYNYDNFLADSIYDWLKEPENVLNACDAIEEGKKYKQNQKIKSIQLFNKHNHKIQVIGKKYHIIEVLIGKNKRKITYKIVYFPYQMLV